MLVCSNTIQQPTNTCSFQLLMLLVIQFATGLRRNGSARIPKGHFVWLRLQQGWQNQQEGTDYDSASPFQAFAGWLSCCCYCNCQNVLHLKFTQCKMQNVNHRCTTRHLQVKRAHTHTYIPIYTHTKPNWPAKVEHLSAAESNCQNIAITFVNTSQAQQVGGRLI